MDALYLRLILAFVISGAWITSATIAAERLGPALGGVLAGMPSNIVVAFFFIGWTQGAQRLFDTTTLFPLTFAPCAVFLVVYAILAQRGFTPGILGALLAWVLLEIPIVLLEVDNFALSLAIWLLTLVASLVVLEHQPGMRVQPTTTVSYTAGRVIWRAVLSGTMVSAAVIMSKVGGPIWGSVVASFPAVMTSTLIITTISSGVRFSRSLTIPLLVSSQVNCMVFNLAVRYTVLSLGVVEATIIGYVLAILSTYLTYHLLRLRQSDASYDRKRRFLSRV